MSQKFKIRQIDTSHEEHIVFEMKKIGVEEKGIQIMLPKSRNITLKIKDLPYPAANILKQQMLSVGGECAVSKHALLNSGGKTDVLLIGDKRHYSVLIEKLKNQYFALDELGEEIRKFINSENKKRIFRCRDKYLDLSEKTYIMGIINVTPDSFSDGGKYKSVDEAVESALRMVDEGADIIDIGGESTRPGAEPVPLEEELNRVIPVIKKLREQTDAVISIDTYKSEVAEEALKYGADIVNDISGFHFDKRMPEIVLKYNAGVILMHIKGTPRDMQKNPAYENLVEEIIDYFAYSIDIAKETGIDNGSIMIDPGIGFGKKWQDNYLIIRYLKEFKSLGYPILIGPSRKSFIGYLLDLPVEERLEGTISAVVCSILNGADIVRVHDVKEVARAVAVADAIAGKNKKFYEEI